MFKGCFNLTLLLFLFKIQTFGQTSDFVVPDTVCVNQNINVQNTSSYGSTYYWNFCTGNLMSYPTGTNLGNIGNLNKPVYSVVVKDGNNYFVFISNNGDGSITRLAFGNSLTNTPVATNLGTFGVLGYYVEGIEIEKDDVSGKWIGLVSWGQVDRLIRLDFGNSLSNFPTAENLGNVNGLMRFAHTIFTFRDGGKWYSFIGNYATNSILRLEFGNSLMNNPTATDMGNIGSLNGPVGFYPILDAGNWYMFVVNRNSNSISRLDFGNSLANLPSGINLGSINNTMNAPRSITILRDCGSIFGFVVNENSNDIVRLTFPNGLLSIPTGTSLGNVASFSFPHHISEMFRIGDDLYAFVLNVNNNSISKIKFTGCVNSSIASSNQFNPPPFSYSIPGTYNINLVIDEGLPTQSTTCKDVVVVSPSKAEFSGDSLVCVGGTINLIASVSTGNNYSWSGPNNYSHEGKIAVISQAGFMNAGLYTLITKNSACSSPPFSRGVKIFQDNYFPGIEGDSAYCAGEIINIGAFDNSVSDYFWQGPNGFTSTLQKPNIGVANTHNNGIYSLRVRRNGCFSQQTNINLIVQSNPIIDLGPDTLICEGSILFLDAKNNGSKYLWSTGDTSRVIQINKPGIYSVIIENGECSSTDEIYIDACNSILWLPNVFTPNKDGINERFKPVIKGTLGSFQMLIFNRWGQQIFETSDALEGWNGDFLGEPCPTGVYYYIIEYTTGLIAKSQEQNIKRGAVTLLR